MGVYIKGMEMPITCCHCPLIGYDPDIEWNDGGRDSQGAYICVVTHELIDNTKREEYCPLVPVPAHGDLIERDAMIGHKEWMRDAWMPEEGITEAVHVADIINAPTIIEAEEV